MKIPPAPPLALQRLLEEQDGAMTASQALQAGLTRRQLRTLVEAGWTRPAHGVYLAPNVLDPFRASVRAALLACPSGVAHGVTAARLHRLWGLPHWTADEQPTVILPVGQTFNHRRGVQVHSGLRADEWVLVDGFPASGIDRTLHALALELSLDELVCAVDSATRLGWASLTVSPRGRKRLRQAVALSDRRSESALETRGRLVLVKAGLAPEALQFELFDDWGRVFARFDMAWPSVRLAIEMDGRDYHDEPDALYRDRSKANAALLDGWRVLRFTWFDIVHRPEWVVATVRKALAVR